MRIRALAVLLFGGIALTAQVAGPSVNMVTGVTWPDGDPFLQRQNEPSMAVSSRNPMHLLAGANDYRSVDLPLVLGDEIGDAWLGVFKSTDGGRSWKSNLLPGYKQDKSAVGQKSPLYGLTAAADPVVRPGPNGMFYFAGLAFDRQKDQKGRSIIFVSRWIDDNLASSRSDTLRYLDTIPVTPPPGDPALFEDKPAIAVDIPRGKAGAGAVCTIGDDAGRLQPQKFPAFRVYAAWTEFLGGENSIFSRIMTSRSEDCGATWSKPAAITGVGTHQGAAIAINPKTGDVFVSWRSLNLDNCKIGSILIAADYGSGFSTPALVTEGFRVFDQPYLGAGRQCPASSPGLMFRTVSYPTIAVDPESGNVYVAWSQRTGNSDLQDGPALIYYSAAIAASRQYAWECLFESCGWSKAAPIDPAPPRQPGHQFMPSLIFSNGKLTAAWYDLRNTNRLLYYQLAENPVLTAGPLLYNPQLELYPSTLNEQSLFPFFVADAPGQWRHTLDVRLAQAKTPAVVTVGADGRTTSFTNAVFDPSVVVSRYAFGTRGPTESKIQQLQVDAPNLPMFRQGTTPFIGDYLDVAGQTFVRNDDGTWRFNTRPGDPENIFVAWTDNRNVVRPRDGNWKNYVPVTLQLDQRTAGGSLYDPSQPYPKCDPLGALPANTGSRNQDIYMARISQGLELGATTNYKSLLDLGHLNDNQPFQRAFPVTVRNAKTEARTYRLKIAQSLDAKASFLDFSAGAGGSSGSPLDEILLSVPPLSSSTRSVFVQSNRNPYPRVRINVTEAGENGSDLPNGLKGQLDLNVDGSLPADASTAAPLRELFDATVSRPEISNPEISNLSIFNPEISNPEISNPEISNPEISNPEISNPEISNPEISNFRIVNPEISNPEISNTGLVNRYVSNPEISNARVANPEISNPEISNSAMTDTTWAVTNTGNTTAAYLVKFLQNQATPAGVDVQILTAKRYNTPVADNCTLKMQPNYTILGNRAIVNPRMPNSTLVRPAPASSKLATAGSTPEDQSLAQLKNVDINDPAIAGVPTVAVAPGERVLVTVRTVDHTTTDPQVARLRFDPATALIPVPVPDAVNKPSNVLRLPLIVLTTALPAGPAGAAYNFALRAEGGGKGDVDPVYTWTPVSLPNGLSVGTSGVISGLPSAGSVDFDVEVKDASSNRSATRRFTLVIQPAKGGPSIATPSPLKPGALNRPYAFLLNSSGGTGALNWSIVSGSLPSGLTLAAGGAISGTPAAVGIFRFTVKLTDGAGATDLRTLAMTVSAVAAAPVITTVANAASYRDGVVAPGELVSIFGVNLWDAEAVYGNIAKGFLGRNIGNLQVTFNGIPSPLVFVCSPLLSPCEHGQINLSVPFEVAGQSVAAVVVTNNGVSSKPFPVAVTAAVPGIFTADSSGTGQASILNEDGTINGPGNPAARRSVIAIYATGGGLTKPAGVTGSVTTQLNTLVLPVSLTIDGEPAAVTYAGDAPGLLAGALQFNVTLPNIGSGNHRVLLTIGSETSQAGVTVFVE